MMQPTWRVINDDCLAGLESLAAGSVQTCVTSPPYYGLRDYGGGPRELGREERPDCLGWATGVPCGGCYVCHMVAVFRAVRRVLRDDGTLWLNLGDSFNAAGRTGHGTRVGVKQGTNRASASGADSVRASAPGLKEKDLLGVPWRVALALQADGWYLRGDIVWDKVNPMPESVTDRPTRAHEFVFLLSKSARYYYDHVAVQEPLVAVGAVHGPYGDVKHQDNGNRKYSGNTYDASLLAGRNKRDVWRLAPESCKDAHFAVMPTGLAKPCVLAGTSEAGCCAACGAPWRRVVRKVDHGLSDRSFRSPHEVNTSGMTNGRGATTLAHVVSRETEGWEPSCMCGNPGYEPDDWVMIGTPTGEGREEDPSLVTGRAGMNRPRGAGEGVRPITRYEQRRYAAQIKASPHRDAMRAEAGSAFAHYLRTDGSGARPVPPDLLAAWVGRGWLEPVAHDPRTPLPTVPCTVLDPFAGRGTTGMVALRYGRTFVGCELSASHAALAHRNLAAVAAQPLLDLFAAEGASFFAQA